jgi:hypothetical protein
MRNRTTSHKHFFLAEGALPLAADRESVAYQVQSCASERSLETVPLVQMHFLPREALHYSSRNEGSNEINHQWRSKRRNAHQDCWWDRHMYWWVVKLVWFAFLAWQGEYKTECYRGNNHENKISSTEVSFRVMPNTRRLYGRAGRARDRAISSFVQPDDVIVGNL